MPRPLAIRRGSGQDGWLGFILHPLPDSPNRWPAPRVSPEEIAPPRMEGCLMEVVVFVGLQGSGKTTFYRHRFGATHVLVSKDLLRNNRRPQRRQMQLIEEALRDGRPVVVDNTNPTVEDRAAIIELARRHEARVVGIHFDSPFEDCLERNAGRSGKAKVPTVALLCTRGRMQVPTMQEGFDRLDRVVLTRSGEFIVASAAGEVAT